MIELCVEKALKLGGSGDDGLQHTDENGGILQPFDLSGIDEGGHFYFKIDPINTNILMMTFIFRLIWASLLQKLCLGVSKSDVIPLGGEGVNDLVLTVYKPHYIKANNVVSQQISTIM